MVRNEKISKEFRILAFQPELEYTKYFVYTPISGQKGKCFVYERVKRNWMKVKWTKKIFLTDL